MHPKPARFACAYTPARSTITTSVLSAAPYPPATVAFQWLMGQVSSRRLAMALPSSRLAIMWCHAFFRCGWMDRRDSAVSRPCPATASMATREVVVRPSTWFTRAPRGYSHAEAATLTTAALTAWRALVGDAKLKAGNTVLALGTGGVSIFALQLVKLMGAKM